MKVVQSLLVSLILLLVSEPMTAAAADASLGQDDFNVALMNGGKSTLRLSNDIRLVVIDPGHGGRDPGGLGRRCQEKDIALSVARQLKSQLEAAYPTIEFMLTRDTDVFIPLADRAGLANDEGADLFISIHANIARNGTAFGTETFVMGDHVQDYNLRVAQRENSVIDEYEGDRDARYDLDPYSDEGHILLRHLQGENLDRSITFAGLVENEFSRQGRKSRGVKQAGFVVLKQATMPAVLVELGFMSNGQEEAYLMSAAGQKRLAQSLAAAFDSYHRTITGKTGLTATPPSQMVGATTTSTVWTAEGVSPKALTYEPAPTVQAEPTTDPLKAEEQQLIEKPTQTVESISFGLQLAATSKRADLTALGWDQLPFTVKEYPSGNAYLYQVRNLPSAEAARRAEAELKGLGVDCFVVAYNGDRKLSGSAFTAVLGR